MNDQQQFSFVRKPVKWTNGRYVFTVPIDQSHLIHPEQSYEVIYRPVGTIMVIRI